MSVVAPRPAATVLLVREGAPFDVFFVKRHGKSGFMANAYVFPGGGVDPGDGDPALLERVALEDPDGLWRQMVGVDTVAAALGHVVAAIREVFEESGALLVRGPDGAAPDMDDPEVAARFSRWRSALNAGEASFSDMVSRESLTLAGDALRYHAHWITPVVERRRFDARFFIARLPPGQALVHDAKEVVASCWYSPKQALDAYEEGGFQLAPPTWRILGDLCAVEEMEALFAGPPGGPEVAPIMPHLTRVDGELVLALPGDPLHPSEPGAMARRIVLRDGRWWAR